MEKLDIKCLVSGKETDGKVAVFKEIVQPLTGPPRHIHRSQLEIFHILGGDLIFELDGNISQHGKGDTIVIPSGSIHAFKNVGQSSAEIHFEMLPAGESEEAFNRIVSEEIADVESFFDQYDMDLIGPPLEQTIPQQ